MNKLMIFKHSLVPVLHLIQLSSSQLHPTAGYSVGVEKAGSVDLPPVRKDKMTCVCLSLFFEQTLITIVPNSQLLFLMLQHCSQGPITDQHCS